MLRPAARSVAGTFYRTLAPGNAFIPQPDPNTKKPPPPGENVLPYELRDIAVKDNIATLTTATTCASQILRAYQSPFEAGVVEELRSHGGNVIGKTNMDEFGMGSHSTNSIFGPVTNKAPYEKISVGGSSGGSAMAVAMKQCDFALGTDTGGSVRLPAAYTGVVGFKPSYGYISRWGVVPYANSLDTVGILARSATSVLTTLRSAVQPDSRDPTSLSEATRSRIRLSMIKSKKRERSRRVSVGQWESDYEPTQFKNIRIGIPMEYNIEELGPGVRQVWRDALDMFQANGATLVPISLPNTKHALSAYYVLAPAEAASNLSKYDGVRYGTRHEKYDDGSGHVLYADVRGHGFAPEVRRRILLGSYTLSSEARDNHFLKAQKVRRLVQRDFDRVFAASNPLLPAQQFDLSDLDESVPMMDKLGPPQVDFIVCPTAPTIAPNLENVANQSPVDSYMNDVFTVPASLAGLPAVSIPFSTTLEYRKELHPNYAGVQIIGQFGDDQRLLTVAERLEAVRDARGNFSPPHSRSKRVIRDAVIQELKKFYLQEKQERAEENRLHFRKILATPDTLPFPPHKKLQWKEYGSELTKPPEIRPTPTYGPRSRSPKTDKEINQDLQDALNIWEQIKASDGKKA